MPGSNEWDVRVRHLDTIPRVLTLARDRVGVKPLYYHADKGPDLTHFCLLRNQAILAFGRGRAVR